MKKMLSFLLLISVMATALCTDSTGGASSASTSQDVCIITSDGVHIPLTDRIKAACGLFRDFEQLPGHQWKDVPLLVHSTILRVLLQLIDDQQRAITSLNSLSFMQLDELYEAADLLRVDPTIRTIIANRIAQELPRSLHTLSKADFKTFLHHAVKHLMPESAAVQSAVACTLVTTGGVQPTISHLMDNVAEFSFSSDGTHVAILTRDNHLHLYDVAQKQTSSVIDNVHQFSFTSDGTQLAIKTKDKTLHLYNITQKQITPALVDHVEQFSFSPTGTQLANSLMDRVQEVSFSPNGAYLAITRRHDMHLYDLAQSQMHDVFEDRATSASWSPDNTHLAFTTKSGDLHLYDIAENKTGPVLLKTIRQSSFSPDSTHLAVIKYGGTLHLYNLLIHAQQQISPSLIQGVDQVTFSPTGTRLAVRSFGTRLQLLDLTRDLDTAQQLLMLYIHNNEHTTTFTRAEIDDLQEGLYYVTRSAEPQAGAPASSQTVEPTLPLPEEAQAPTSEQLRTMYGLRHESLLDGLPEELHAYITP